MKVKEKKKKYVDDAQRATKAMDKLEIGEKIERKIDSTKSGINSFNNNNNN